MDVSLNLNRASQSKEQGAAETAGTIANAANSSPALFSPAAETAGTIASGSTSSSSGASSSSSGGGFCANA